MQQPTLAGTAISSHGATNQIPTAFDLSSSPEDVGAYQVFPIRRGSNTSSSTRTDNDKDGYLDDSAMVGLRSLLEEQCDRLAARIEAAVLQNQQHLLHHLKLDLCTKPVSNGSNDTENELGIDGIDRASDFHTQATNDLSNGTKKRILSSGHTKDLEEAVQNFNMKEEEEDHLYERAQDISKASLHRVRKTASAYYDETDYQWRRKLREILSSTFYEVLIGALILINSIYIGCELEYMVDHRLDKAPVPLAMTNYTFTAIFSLELLLRIAAEGPAFVYEPSRRAWNWVDSFLVIFSLIESGIDVYQSVQDGKVNGVEHLGSVRAIRVIRITRLLRIFRVARIVRFVRAFRTLIYSIMCTLKSLAWAMLLLLIIVYVFALVFTQAVTDYLMEVNYQWGDSMQATCSSTDPLGGDHLCVLDLYWGSLSSAIFTLYKSIAGGLSWDVAVQPLHQINPLWEFIFAGYISFTYLAVLNVVTGVFCQSAIEGAQHDHDLLVQNHIANKKLHIKRLSELFHTIDSDRSGVITINELTQHIEDAEVKAFFDSMDLSTTDAWTLFKLLDHDKSHAIDIEEFVDGILRLRGFAKSVDMAKLLFETRWTLKNVKNLANYVNLEMSRLRHIINARFDEYPQKSGAANNCESL